jgi:hypothetical protein
MFQKRTFCPYYNSRRHHRLIFFSRFFAKLEQKHVTNTEHVCPMTAPQIIFLFTALFIVGFVLFLLRR